MVAPVNRRFTFAQPTALNTDANASDDETSETFLQINQPNQIIDVYNDPAPPTTGNRYTIKIFKGGADTGRRLYSDSLNTSSAGRSRTQMDLTPGMYQFRVRQTAQKAGGSFSAHSFVIQFIRSL